MSSASSSPSTQSFVAGDYGADARGVPGSTIIAEQPSRFRQILARAAEFYHRAEDAFRRTSAVLLPLLKLSKYGLGVALILCVTVIWVASSEWIQYIFGTLEFDKPFFLTYFNTTGFCLWNAGFLLSPRWRRTPWDEEAKSQPVCMEDARLEERPEAAAEPENEQEMESTQREGGVDVRATPRRLHLVTPSLDDRNASVNLTLSCAVTNRSVLHDGRPLLAANSRLGHAAAVQPSTRSPPLQPYAASGARSVGVVSPPPSGALLPLNASHGSLCVNDAAAGGTGGGGGDGGGAGTGSLLGDNDDLDMESDLGTTSGTMAATQMHMEDECRDYSLPTSCASSAREEVLSVMLTDEDDASMPAEPTTSSAGETGAPAVTALPWEATRRSTVISSELLQRDQPGLPHRRHYHQRARRPRVLRYSLRRIWMCALYFCPLWFLANYLFNLSLSITSVASNTILSSTSSIWTLVLSYILLRQKVGIHRIVAVALCVGGSIMVGLADKNASSGHNTVGGDIVALLSAFFYAAYTSVLKWHLPDDERFAMGMVFGAVGVLNFFLLWPGLVVLSVTGAERFAWPSWRQFWPLLLNALIGTNLSDVLWARSVVLTSPVVATLGLSLTTPLAMIVDAIFKHAHFNGLYIAGAIMVMAGFLLANLPIRINIGV